MRRAALLRGTAATLGLIALVRVLGPLPELAGRALGPALQSSAWLALPVALGAAVAAAPPQGRTRLQRTFALALRVALAGSLWLAFLHLVDPAVLRKRALVLAAAAALVQVGLALLPKRRGAFTAALALAAFAAAAPELSRALRRAPRVQPAGTANLLLITIDTVRQDALGCYGNRRATSPHLDRLAAEGVLFEDALAQSPHTHASIATLLTSTYPIEHRSRRESQRLAPENHSLAEHLAAHGYRTAAFLDNPWLSRELGFDQGYDDFAPHARAGAAEAWLARHAQPASSDPRRFFLHVHLLQPHAPYLAVAPWAQEFQPDWPVDAPYQRDVPIQVLWDAKRFADVDVPQEHLERMRALYSAEVRAMDEQIGAVFGALAAAGVADETLVVVASDHGEEFLEHGSLGHSHSLYQELVRVPLLLRLPGKQHAGRRIREQAQLLDVAPTITELLGVGPLPRARGGSWAPFLSGGAPPASAALGVAEVYRVDTRHLFLASTPDWTLHASVVPLGRDRYDDWELAGPAAADFALGTRVQLFDRRADPGERHDLSAARPEVVTELLAALQGWRRAQQR